MHRMSPTFAVSFVTFKKKCPKGKTANSFSAYSIRSATADDEVAAGVPVRCASAVPSMGPAWGAVGGVQLILGEASGDSVAEVVPEEVAPAQSLVSMGLRRSRVRCGGRCAH
ncbi:hypothetical protein HPB48_005374 [Haemaphysalis longicornis]|uniref:Uncharacterized protein n=1 Tax=Haemaphysalis longicornis TaxID=44386 RepID=A0A9J6GH48_HAELO|nr:hypothetical protein HPB48_005374 [Haemaphysalis longicornis]